MIQLPTTKCCDTQCSAQTFNFRTDTVKAVKALKFLTSVWCCDLYTDWALTNSGILVDGRRSCSGTSQAGELFGSNASWANRNSAKTPASFYKLHYNTTKHFNPTAVGMAQPVQWLGNGIERGIVVWLPAGGKISLLEVLTLAQEPIQLPTQWVLKALTMMVKVATVWRWPTHLQLT